MFIFRYNLKKDVRESLFDACNEWTKAVGQKRKFMGGDQPNLADLVNELYMHYPQYSTVSCISKSSRYSWHFQPVHVWTDVFFLVEVHQYHKKLTGKKDQQKSEFNNEGLYELHARE